MMSEKRKMEQKNKNLKENTIGPFIRGKIRRVLPKTRPINKTQTIPYKRHIRAIYTRKNKTRLT